MAPILRGQCFLVQSRLGSWFIPVRPTKQELLALCKDGLGHGLFLARHYLRRATNHNLCKHVYLMLSFHLSLQSPLHVTKPPELGALQQLFTISDTFPGTPSRGCSVSNEAVPSTRLKRTCKQIKGENADRITRALTTYTTVTGCRVGHGGGPSGRAPRQGTNQEGRGAVLAGRGCDSGRRGRTTQP